MSTGVSENVNDGRGFQNDKQRDRQGPKVNVIRRINDESERVNWRRKRICKLDEKRIDDDDGNERR
jgi:hypothetical protein